MDISYLFFFKLHQKLNSASSWYLLLLIKDLKTIRQTTNENHKCCSFTVKVILKRSTYACEISLYGLSIISEKTIHYIYFPVPFFFSCKMHDAVSGCTHRNVLRLCLKIFVFLYLLHLNDLQRLTNICN